MILNRFTTQKVPRRAYVIAHVLYICAMQYVDHYKPVLSLFLSSQTFLRDHGINLIESLRWTYSFFIFEYTVSEILRYTVISILEYLFIFWIYILCRFQTVQEIGEIKRREKSSWCLLGKELLKEFFIFNLFTESFINYNKKIFM